MNILLHAPTKNAYRRAKNNRTNILKDCPDATVEIVVNAQGAIEAFADKKRDDCAVCICANSLRAVAIVAPENLRIIPSAMLHLARRQSEGWTYIRA